MAILTDSDVADLVEFTRDNVALEQKTTDICSSMTKFWGKKLLEKEKVVMQSGDKIKGNAIHSHNASAQMVGLFQVITPNYTDVLTKFWIPWRHMTYHWTWERRFGLMNVGRNQIVDIIKAQRKSADISCAEKVEVQVWNKPADDTNEEDVFGFPYWIVPATAAAGSHQGGNPTGFTSGAGNLSSTTYSKWKNWAAGWTDVNDLLRKMRQGYRATEFVSPVDEEEYRRGVGSDCTYYMNESTIDQLEEALGARNDNHRDLAQFMGATTFKRRPLHYVAYLDGNSNGATNPVYMIDHGCFFFVILKGDNFHEHRAMNQALQPNVFVISTDVTFNLLCTNRRKQGIISQL